MSHLADAVIWRYGHVATVHGETLVAWRHPTEPQPTPADLDTLLADYGNHLAGQLRPEARARIDAAAEAARQAFLTPGAGQAMVYREKAAEAVKAQAEIDAGGTPDAADYPFLAAEIGVTAPTLAEVVTTVNVTAAAWRQAGAAIEAARLAAKRDIDAEPEGADLAERLDAIIDAVAWPAPPAG